ncbi:MAG TPA: hypothetical protein VFQ41_01730 [Candidatus Angelobacter sp.]|nr:hypothetical protein [Candidatus Angelobacter sp.]
MENASYPSIVFCLGEMGSAIGTFLAEGLAERPATPLLSIWAVSCAGHELAPNCLYERQCGRPLPVDAPIRTDSVAHLVIDVVNRALSLEDTRLPAIMEGAVGLRLLLLGVAPEVTELRLSDFASAFHAAAKWRRFPRYLAEACLVLPQDREGPGPPDETRPEPDLMLSSRSGAGQNSSGNSFTYWWWLGNINASGLALPPLPAALEEMALVMNGLLATPPEHLPVSMGMLESGTQSMSAGYAELVIPRKEIVEYFTALNTCRLVKDLFLGREERVNEKAMRRRAWAFAASSECQEVLQRTSHTEGGERIWPGFNRTVPPEVIEGEVSEFLRTMHEELDQFLNNDLKRIMAALAGSVHSSREKLLAALEAETQSIANQSEGGLFDALAFLAEMAAFLLETTELSETESASNLQHLRRGYDRWYAQELHLESLPRVNHQEETVQRLRRELSQIMYLRNISAPPALDRNILEGLRWSGNQPDLSLEQQAAELTERLEQAIRLWAQEVATAEHNFQQSCHDTQPEQARREKRIADCEDALRLSAIECKKLLHELSLAPKASWWRELFFFRQKKMWKEKNDRLGLLQRVLPRHAGEVVTAYASRMQLSVDRGLYAARDNLLQDALSGVRALHGKISGTIETLRKLREQSAAAAPPGCRHVLRKLLFSSAQLDPIFERLCNKDYTLEMAGSLSPWEVCRQAPEKTIAQMRKLAGEPFTAVLNWEIDNFMRVANPPELILEQLVQWLDHASRPLAQGLTGASPDYAIIRAPENSEFSKLLRSRFGQAIWMNAAELAGAAVVQVRELVHTDLPSLSFNPENLNIPS